MAQVNDRLGPTDDTRVASVTEIPSPESLIAFLPVDKDLAEFIERERKEIADIVSGKDDRLLVVVGPCSIHDPKAAIEYSKKLKVLSDEVKDRVKIVMRTYFEKPRTTVGWKGLLYDPKLDGSNRMNEGLMVGRQLLRDINQIGLPVGVECLDTISPQYYADLVSWGAIGARTTESQLHRELASGLSFPMGFKNGTTGDTQIALDAMQSSANPHSFLGTSKSGKIAQIETSGNPDSHVILRGGGGKTNYDAGSVAAAVEKSEKAGVNTRLMIDFSHANSEKVPANQIKVAVSVAEQIASGNKNIMGVMIESHLVAGAQKHTPGKNNPKDLVYGQSITDGCIAFDGETEDVIRSLADSVEQRRKAA